MQVITTYRAPAPQGIIATVGMFDGVHLGHRHLLAELDRRAKEAGMASAVITFTWHPLEVIDITRKPRMLTTVAERLRLIESCGVDYCFLLEFTPCLMEQSASAFLRRLKETIGLKGIVAGFDNSFGKKGEGSLEESAKTVGVDFYRHTPLVVDSVKVASSEIREMILDRRIGSANRLLGRYFSVSGSVVHGRELGRTLGFPTANIEIGSCEKILPSEGVYACLAYIGQNGTCMWPAVVNIGTNPTVDDTGKYSVEAHLIGLDNINLYGLTLNLLFVDFIRKENKFGSIEELAEQLGKDVRKCLETLESSDKRMGQK